MNEHGALFQRILVPVDGSMFSFYAVRLACRMAAIHGSELMIINVVDSVLVDQVRRLSGRSSEDMYLQMRDSAGAFLRDMELHAVKHGAPVSTMLSDGVPHEVILAEADRWKADLVVMGKLGSRGISGILMGSVAQRVIEFARIPVLLAIDAAGKQLHIS